MPQKVSIIEDEPEIANRLNVLLSENSDFDLHKVYSTGEEGVKGVIADTPEMLICDLGLPGIQGHEVISEIKNSISGDKLKIVVYTVFEDEDSILKAIEAGANGYVLKDTSLDLFLAELTVVSLGGSTLTPRVAQRIIKNYTPSNLLEKVSLSSREEEVLNLISIGFKYSDIARDLKLSIHTVRTHVENLYKKLNVNNRSQAILKGQKVGLINE